MDRRLHASLITSTLQRQQLIKMYVLNLHTDHIFTYICTHTQERPEGYKKDVRRHICFKRLYVCDCTVRDYQTLHVEYFNVLLILFLGRTYKNLLMNCYSNLHDILHTCPLGMHLSKCTAKY